MTSFCVGDFFVLTGRTGTTVTRPVEESKQCWAAGERWACGDWARCGDRVARVVGIERFAVPPGHPAHFDGSLMLDIDQSVVERGQIWLRIDPTYEPLPGVA